MDTNVLSELMRAEPAAHVRDWVDRQWAGNLWMTSVSAIELWHGLYLMPSSKKRDRLSADFDILMQSLFAGRIASLDLTAASETAKLIASRRQRGRIVEVRDSQIAGIAIAQHAAIATRNARDFSDLPIDVIDPWT